MSGKSASREVTITNPQGLHLRPAHAFVTMANQFACKIEIEKNGERVDGKSILSILAGCGPKHSNLFVSHRR